jgi:hypothetical protein
MMTPVFMAETCRLCCGGKNASHLSHSAALSQTFAIRTITQDSDKPIRYGLSRWKLSA